MPDMRSMTQRGLIESVLVDLVWGVLLFNLARVLLLMPTLGRDPRGATLERHARWMSLPGLLTIMPAVACIRRAQSHSA